MVLPLLASALNTEEFLSASIETLQENSAQTIGTIAYEY